MTSRIREYMSADHRRCDAHFVATEEAVLAGDWPAASAAFGRYGDALDTHLAMEEEVLFPGFEAETGMPAATRAAGARARGAVHAAAGAAAAHADRP